MSDADVRRPVPAWLWGGGLLAASAALPMLGQIYYSTPALVWAGRLLTAAALIVFAVGIRREGSIVARRPVGIVALVAMGVVPPVIELLTPAVGSVDDSGFPQNLWLLQLIGYGSLTISVAAALVAVVEIARARVVPDPWRWAPAWGLAVAAGIYVVAQVTLIAVDPQGAAELVDLLATGAVVGNVFVPLALGILAMVLGARGLTAAPAQVYPPV